ncbi:hypothetical protein [Mucilaginibacter boryungensis]|uniref:GAF domain-containing protein n=1 Tax=Mucilaginibacter boryungensis TaxID=768480 RepID=A0ABR9XEL5_9SPHI|nr:hypothetical protein [Mucilaginibacter boryungensis]MBE9665822.1 hypothetical protein [Mucilaginibacter boryungensis]
MHNKLINIKAFLKLEDMIAHQLSFRPFISYLKHRVEVEKTIKSEFYRFVLNKFRAYPQFETDCIGAEEAAGYTNLLELVYTVLSPTIEDEGSLFWAIGNPFRSKIVFSTDAFYTFIEGRNQHDQKNILSDSALKQRQIDFLYRLILQKLYNFPPDTGHDNVYALPDKKNGLIKYYRVHNDVRFIDVIAKGKLPEINPEMIEPFLYEGADMSILKDIIPLDMFRLEGFTVITIHDITAKHSIETIRHALINNTPKTKDLYKNILSALQTLSGNPSVQFGLMPFIRVNNQLVFDPPECKNSMLVRTGKKRGVFTCEFLSFIKDYIQKPEAMFFITLSDKKIAQYPFLKRLKDANIRSYVIIPVYYNRHLAGALEIFSEQKVVFYEKLLSRLQNAIPLLSQLLHNTSEQFTERLQRIIKTSFTNLQPAVEWKFNEAAWHYLIAGQKNSKSEMELVSFHNVHPLYGAIDIRDSTIQHNKALKQDIKILIDKIADLLKHLKQVIPNKRATADLVKKHTQWLSDIRVFERANDEAMLNELLKGTINPYFFALRHKYPVAEKLICDYEKAVDETGLVYQHRSAVEKSIKMINRAMGNYFDAAQVKLQKIYPCYFEKFRSDGIEYDVYTGQSLAPDLPFKDKYLTNFRKWQLKAMIDVAKITRKLETKMPVPLQTASLIFVHSSQIDICFRNDERHFDVEGYYNIRYEVIKKRIDKVHLKSTKERLTQPGKIALVYFNNTEAEEYIALIKQFQKDGSLKKDMEFVELENLQGVTGLKALRVSIQL